jgi:predicted RNA-binding Zn-ribbon protein involved in translation (DUF1610 family)
MLELEFYSSRLLDALVETRAPVAIELLADLHREGPCDAFNRRRSFKYHLDELLKSVTEPELRGKIERSVHERADEDRQADERADEAARELKAAAAKEKAHKDATRRCPKCGENPAMRVEGRDVDDGWVTHYWMVCTKCGSKIEDGHGQVVGTAMQAGHATPEIW